MKGSWKSVSPGQARLNVCGRDSPGFQRTLDERHIEEIKKKGDELNLQYLKDTYLSHGDPYDIFEIINIIGKGSVGEVFFARNKETGTMVAIKKLELQRKGKSRLKLILNEISIMALSKSENIVNYLDTFQVNEELWVVMEYMEGGSLYDLVKLFHKGVKLTEGEMCYITFEVLKGLHFIHGLKRIHRDIKVDNILLSVTGDVKLADFGSAVQLTFDRNKRTTLAGTPYYMSPEIIRGDEYDEKIDIWSLGIMIYEMCLGEPPYYALSPSDALQQIAKSGVAGLPESDFSPRMCNFVNKNCLIYSPKERKSTDILLTNDWFQTRCDKESFSLKLKQYKKDLLVDSTGSACIIL